MLRRTGFFTATLPSSLTLATALLVSFGFGCSGATTIDTPNPVDDTGTDGSTCPGSQISCGGTCTDPKLDPKNCGACGTSCKADEVCNGGKCGSTCSAPLMKCGDRCADTSIDPNNCGTCGTKCVAGEVCGPSGCGLTCPGTLTKCDKSCFDTQNDPKNCGACGTACADGEVCVAGKCATSCSAPLKACAGKCTNTDYDPENCGACGTKCDPGVACIGGGCGKPDTTDDDGDTISNYHEGKTDKVDTDADGKFDYLDDDSDGDGILDKDEAGDTDVKTPPVDSDLDGKPDFQDTDSDNDGLLDKDEATKYKTSPTKPDTDGDGYTDAEEVAAGTDPLLATSNPGSIGGFSFDLPYKGLPRSQDLVFKPAVKKADVAFITDTTGSMGGPITNLKTQLSSISTKVVAKVPDTAFGVGDHKDFPTGFYGGTGDWPFKLRQRVTTILTDAQTAVNAMSASGGSDGPESQVEAIYQAANGGGFADKAGTGFWTPKFDPTVGFDATKGHGSIGGMGFRKDALPIFVLSTDISEHRYTGDTDNPSPGTTTDEFYAATDFGTQKPHLVKEALAAMTTIGAKFMGIAIVSSDPVTYPSYHPRPQLEYWSLKTGAYIDADTTGKCATGLAGALINGVADPGGSTKKVCPLVFSASTSGTGVDTAVVNAITSFVAYVSFKTIWVEARDNTATTTIDETKFYVRAVPVAFAKPLPVGCGSPPSITDLLPTGGDGTFDSFSSVCPGTTVSFTLVMQNTTVPATCADQVFSMKVVVIGDGTVEADSRVVTVRVPGDKTLCK